MTEKTALVAAEPDRETMITVLTNSLYPGAAPQSVGLVLEYCHAAKLDPMMKPVHIVPMWDQGSGRMRDVIMPGIGLYRTQAARSGQYAGMTEPEFGPTKTEKIGGTDITYPEWCRVTVKRQLSSGFVADFVAIERWLENYARKGGKEKSVAPNAMWMRRPFGQLAKCASAQALRFAFPELTGAQPSAEEIEGKAIDEIEHETIVVEQPSAIKNTDSSPEMSPAEKAAAVHDEAERRAQHAAKAEAIEKAAAAAEVKPAEKPAEKAAPKTDGKPMTESQVRILMAKLKNASIPLTMLAEHFGDITVLRFDQFQEVQDWIKEQEGTQ